MHRNELNSSTNNSNDNNKKQKIQNIILRQSYKRRLMDKIVSGFAILCVLVAIIPLGSILLEVIKNGGSAISIQLLIQPPGAIGSAIGGIAPAIQGTLIVVGLASLIAVPIGVLTGIYLSEFASSNGSASNCSKIIQRCSYRLTFCSNWYSWISNNCSCARLIFSFGRCFLPFDNHDADRSENY